MPQRTPMLVQVSGVLITAACQHKPDLWRCWSLESQGGQTILQDGDLENYASLAAHHRLKSSIWLTVKF